MRLDLGEIARALQVQNRIIEVKDQEIKELLGGDYLQEGKAILLYGSLSGPIAVLLGVELIGIDTGQLAFCTIFFNRERELEWAHLRKFEPDAWYVNGSWIDFVRTLGEELDILRIFRNGSCYDDNLNTKFSESVFYRLGAH